MIPPRTKSFIRNIVLRYVTPLQVFKNSNPVVMVGETKFDRIDQKVLKESAKLNNRQINSSNGVKIQGVKKKYQKRKPAITYRSYTVQFKKKLVKRISDIHLQSGYPLSKIIRSKARELNIHPKNIFRWFNTKQIKKKQGGRKAQFPQMERRLAQFIINNPKMKRKQILRQAKKIMEDLSIPGRQYFNFSKGWYQRFRERMVKRKVLPGKIQAKNQLKDGQFIKSQFESQQFSSQSSSMSAKKQQFFKKQEFDDIKMQYFWDQDQESQDRIKFQDDWQQYEDQQDEDCKYEVKNQQREQVTHINADQFLISYDTEINKKQNCQKKQNRNKKQEKISKEQKKEQNLLQQNTFNQSGNYSIDFPQNDQSTNKIQISIFASDDQN